MKKYCISQNNLKDKDKEEDYLLAQGICFIHDDDTNKR